jgi:hypothetical protein
MKHILPILGFTAVLASCGIGQSKQVELDKLSAEPVVVISDTMGLADYKAFQQWKQSNDAASYAAAHQAAYAAEQQTRKASKPVVRHTSSRSHTGSYPAMEKSTEADYPGASETSTSSEPVQEKKGWSKAAKGAAIGAGGGAVVGAVVNKRNRAVGAAIGGVVGAGVGYGIGRHMDKKDGRY